MNFWSVEHFFDIFSIKIRFSLSNVLIWGESNVLITEESNFDEKNVEEMFIWSEVHWEKKYSTYKIETLVAWWLMSFRLSITAYLSLVKIKLQSCTDSSKLQFFWQMHSNISKSRLFSHDKLQGQRLFFFFFPIPLDATIHREEFFPRVCFRKSFRKWIWIESANWCELINI